jgi:hypothetical protein
VPAACYAGGVGEGGCDDEEKGNGQVVRAKFDRLFKKKSDAGGVFQMEEKLVISILLATANEFAPPEENGNGTNRPRPSERRIQTFISYRFLSFDNQSPSRLVPQAKRSC